MNSNTGAEMLDYGECGLALAGHLIAATCCGRQPSNCMIARRVMPRYKVIVQWIGTTYHGFQSQGKVLEEQNTIQEVLEQAVSMMTQDRSKVNVYGCGRTDAGVHAIAMPVHFELERCCKKTGVALEPLNEDKLLMALNFHLKGTDINVTGVHRVSPTFHARKDALQRTYLYRVVHGMSTMPIFERNRAHLVFDRLDVAAMNEAAQYFVGTHDFTSFRAKRCESASPVRRLDSFTVDTKSLLGLSKGAELINIICTAKSFLYHQVRIMVAFLIKVGMGQFKPEDVARELLERNRGPATSDMAPAAGLYFMSAQFGNDEEG